MTTIEYTPNQRKRRRELITTISKARSDMKVVMDEHGFPNPHRPPKSIESSWLECIIREAHRELAQLDNRDADGQDWYDKCDRRYDKAWRDYHTQIRWVGLELILTAIQHRFGMYRKYTLHRDVFYSVYPQ